MDDVFVYFVKLPGNVREMVTPCDGGHTVYIDERLDRDHRMKEYEHAVRHIERNDWSKDDVQSIEAETH